METLAPPLRLAQQIRYAIESGESVRLGLQDYLVATPDEWTPDVKGWLLLVERGCSTAEHLRRSRSPARRHLLLLIERGLAGEPILNALGGMEEEIREQALLELDGFLGRLPFRLLLPLLFLIFPAFLLLLLGPLLIQVVQGMA